MPITPSQLHDLRLAATTDGGTPHVKITGSYTVDAPREKFYEALQDPAVLAPHPARLRVARGPRRGLLRGDGDRPGSPSIRAPTPARVQLRDKQAPESYRLSAKGSGAPGTIQADAELRLETDGATTVVHYDADAVVGGMIGGVGQRMIAGAARKTAGEFFSAVANEVLHGPPAAPVPAEAAPAAAPAGAPAEAPAVGQVFAGAPAAAPTADRRGLELLGAFVLGAAVALAGVLVGRRSVVQGSGSDGGR
jgi:uncharacterized protein